MATKCAINGRQWGAYDGRRQAVFQNSQTGHILNHRFWTRVSEQIFDQLTENFLRRFKYERL
jgi:hypothetical protein